MVRVRVRVRVRVGLKSESGYSVCSLGYSQPNVLEVVKWKDFFSRVQITLLP